MQIGAAHSVSGKVETLSFPGLTHYRHVIIPDIDLRESAEKPLPEEFEKGKLIPTQQDKVQRYNRKTAAISELRATIVNACKREGTKIVFAEEESKDFR